MGSEPHAPGGPSAHAVEQVLRTAGRVLSAAGIGNAAGDARRLLAAATGCTVADFIRDPARSLSAAELERFEASVSRRIAREPVSRIIGMREFYGRSFAVTPDVLDPRQDTETLIEVALDICRAEDWCGRPIRILDLGTGSGAILLTLLAELPCASGRGIDVSAGAIVCAQANAKALGLAGRSTFVVGDMCLASLADFDLIVSNPPYIPAAGIASLEPEVSHYDPRLALDGGGDGLEFYRIILSRQAQVRDASSRPQWVVLEFGAGQLDQVIEIAILNGFLMDRIHAMLRRDLEGNTRCVAISTRM